MHAVVLKVSVRAIERELLVQPCYVESVSYFADNKTNIGMVSGAIHLILDSQEEVRKILGMNTEEDYVKRRRGPASGGRPKTKDELDAIS